MIRYIVRVEVCRARHLARAVVSPAAAVVVLTEPAPFEALDIKGLASVEDTEELQDAVSLHILRLTATLACRAALPREPLALRLTAADGTRWLMGTSSRPFPAVVQKDTHPARPSEAAAVTLTATLSGPLPLLEVMG